MIGGRFPVERSVLIQHGYVLTLDPALGDLPDTDVLIEGETITRIGRDLEVPSHANVIDARNRIVMPGFVDTHRHTWQTPVRGVLPSLTHRDVLEFATIDGARACALDHKVGTITPGKQADIVLIRTDQVNVAPVVDPVATVVIAADTSNVDTVMVAGRIVKQKGQPTRVDLPSLLRRLDATRDHLLSQAGTISHWVLSRRD